MANKKDKTTSNKELKKDLKKLQEDFESLNAHEELSHDPKFLGTLAGDILSFESEMVDYEDENLAHYVITTPWGAPFASNLSLFDAALSLQHQDPEQSDLANLLEDAHLYGHQFENQMLKIFEDALEDI